MELQDKIGRQQLVDKMEYLIKNLPQDEHFCLALDGEWGSGKSFVMGMLQNEFESHSDKYLVINYDAWKNNFYPDPLIAILYCVLDSIPKQHLAKKDLRLVLRAAKQVARDKIANGVDFFIDELYKTGGWPSVCAFAMEIIKLVIKQAKSSILDNKLFDDYKSYQTLLNESIAVLNALTAQKTKDGKQRRLIILVDEIDRCLPNEQLIVLERLHHLFEAKNCVVIVALNKASIESVFERSYGGHSKTYFRKFFDYNFKLPMKYQTLLNNLIRECVDELNENLPPENLLVKQDGDYVSQCLGKWCADCGGLDNRECQRLVKIAKEICKCIPQGAINYGYFWFIFKMMFEKLYGNHFNIFKNGTASNLYFVDELCYMTKLLDIISTFPFGAVSIPIYNDMKINNLNYMLNQFAQRNNANLLSSRSSLWCFQHGVKAICSMTCLDEIMGWIDNYKE